MNDTYEQRLLALLRERSYRRGEVTLASGAKSDFYIDGRMVAVHPEGAYLIGEVIYERIKDLDFDAIGGAAVGAVPLVTSAVIRCHHHGREAEGFWVRAEAKSHGSGKRIDGRLPPNARAVFVEDVVTSGASVLAAIEAAEAEGASVVTVITLVDRQQGAAEKFAERGYHYEPVFTREDFVTGVAADATAERP